MKRIRTNGLVVSSLFCIFSLGSTQADTLHVSPSSPQNGPGTDWATAFHTIQDAIDAAEDFDTVLVTNGTFHPAAQIMVTNAITVVSLGGRDETIVDGQNARRCFNLGSPSCILDGFTIQNGNVFMDYGGGILCSNTTAVITNCTIQNCTADYGGGGLAGGAAFDCIIKNNSVKGDLLTGNGYGGGVYRCHATRCSIRSNGVTVNSDTLAVLGGGAYDSMLLNCRIENNSVSAEGISLYSGGASKGGGVYGGTAYNCLMRNNTATGSSHQNIEFVGGGACDADLYNCTISDNQVISTATFENQTSAAGISGGSAQNCIIWDNWDNHLIYSMYGWEGGTSDCFSPATYSCAPELTHGASGNITNAPLFIAADNYGLQSASPGINAGINQTWMADATDLDGNPRIRGGTVDMGAYEYLGSPVVDITDNDGSVYGEAGTYTVNGTNNVWTEGTLWWTNTANGASGTLPVSGFQFQVLSIPLEFHANTISVYGTNEIGEAASDSVTLTRLIEHGYNSPIHYVSTNGSAVYPYTSWATAANDIQTAVDAATAGDTVLVTNGTYSTGGASVSNMPARVVVAKVVTVQSANGAEHTFIVGGGATNGPDAVRCAYLSGGATLTGFTLTGGHTQTTGSEILNQCGGGVFCDDDGRVLESTISGNFAANAGGGIYCYRGGSIDRCTITGNTASDRAGGVFCHLAGTVNNCTIGGNTANNNGGGAYCYGGGSVNNCTITDNTALGDGGGAYIYTQGSFVNCIVWDNHATGSNENWLETPPGAASWNNCCTVPPVGDNFVGVDPLFVAADNLRLQPGSPCIDAGRFENWMASATDLDGNPRIARGMVDIGAYEYPLDYVPDGPMDTLPGSSTFTWDGNQSLGPCEDGNMARSNSDYMWVTGNDGVHPQGTSGKTMYIGPVAIAADTDVYWGPADAGAVKLSLQAGGYVSGETMQYSASQSDLPNGILRYTGSTTIYIWDPYYNYPYGGYISYNRSTRWTMTVTDAAGGTPVALSPTSSAGLNAGIGGVLRISTPSATYKVHTLFEVYNYGWQPAYDYYNNAETPYGSGGAQYTFNHGFWYQPQEIRASAIRIDTGSVGIDWSGLLSSAGYTVYSTTNLLTDWYPETAFTATSNVSETTHSTTFDATKFFKLQSND